MRLTIERAALLRGLTHVQSVVERRNTIPILSNLLLIAQDNGIKLVATDLDIEIAETIPADVQIMGAACAPAHNLYEFVKRLPEGARVQIALTGDEPRLFIGAGQAQLHLPVLSAADFPQMPETGLGTRFTLHPAELARLMAKTRFAISTEETRYYLNGIFLHTVSEGAGSLMRAVATDGHRLALAQTAAPEGSMPMPGVIVPRKTVAELMRLLDDTTEDVEIAVSEQKIRFALGDAVLTSKLIDGSFPAYDRVIPKQNSRHLRLANRSFAGAVDRVATVAAERSRSVQLYAFNNKLTLTVSNPASGLATEDIEAEFSDEAIKIGFNARYLLDVSGQISGDDAVFEFADAGSPTLVRDPEDAHALYVLMPLRV